MSDPTAQVVVTATDRTAAALKSAERGLQSLQRSARGVRSALGAVGVVLSARAFAGWIAGALDAKKMTDEQIEATREARAAMAQMKAASDELARSLATTLAPAMQKVAEIAVGLNHIFFNFDAAPLEKEINDLKSAISSFEKTHGVDTGIGYRVYSKADEARIAELNKQLDDLKRKQLDLLTGGGEQQLQEFDLGAIRDKRAEVMRSMPDFDVNAPSDDMRKRAEQITTETRTELEKQIATMHEADQLLSKGLISEDTLQRLQDSMLQPIEVTAKRMKDANVERLKNLVDTFKSEEQLEQDRYAQRLDDLQDLYDAELVQREEFQKIKEELELEHQGRMTDIEHDAAMERLEQTQRNQTDTVSTIVSGLTDATAALANSSKRMFELNKKLGKAEAVVNAYRAIQQVWADPTLPFYAKIAATAVTAVKTAANISAINSATFGGGTTPSAAGTPTVNGNPVSADRVITVRGINPNDLFTGRALVNLINEATADGAKLVLAR